MRYCCFSDATELISCVCCSLAARQAVTERVKAGVGVHHKKPSFPMI